MSKIWIPGGGGGADLDVVTAGAGDVLSGKVIVDKDGNPLTGTMPDNTSLTSNGTVPGISSSYPDVPTREGSNLQMTTATDGVVRISMCPPSGYYPGAVNDGSYVNRPASDFGDAPTSAIDPDYTATSQHGLKIRGTMPTMAGGTKTPSTSQITVACSGYKMTSNIVIPAFSLPEASKLISGYVYSIYGKSVTGTGGAYPAYASLNYYGSWGNRTESITIGESGTYFIYGGPIDASGNWSIKQDSTTLYSGTNVWYDTRKYLNSGVKLSLTSYVKTAIILIACKYSP